MISPMDVVDREQTLSAALRRLRAARGGGSIAACVVFSIALTNAGATALKAREAEESLRGNKLDDAAIAEAARLAMSICDPAADQRGDVEYKTAMSGEMPQRALRTARERAQ